MMLQVGDDGVVSSVNEEDLIYVDKNELEQFVESYHQLEKENEQLKSENIDLRKDLGEFEKSINIQGLIGENEQLKSENKRLTDKLNKTALELVDECISQGKATEISEMSYREFLDYRAENGKPMELQL